MLRRRSGLASLLLVACGGQSDEPPSHMGGAPAGGALQGGRESSGATPATSAVPAQGAGSSLFSQCPTPLGTAEELARTPRADLNLELLALALDAGQLTATQPTYERVVADVGAIRASAPSLESLAYRGPHDGRTMRLFFGERATEGLGAGTYSAWDCLLEAYRVEVHPVIDLVGGYTPMISLGGIFDLPRVAEVFAELPDASAEISLDTEVRTLCAARAGERYEYVVDRTNGSCRSSCSGSARYFASDAAGEIELLDIWVASNDEPAPDWFVAICE